MGKKIGLDVGDVRIGIAVSDMLGMIANARESYTRKGLEKDLRYFTDPVSYTHLTLPTSASV